MQAPPHPRLCPPCPGECVGGAEQTLQDLCEVSRGLWKETLPLKWVLLPGAPGPRLSAGWRGLPSEASWGQLAVLRWRVWSAHTAGTLAWLSVTLSLGKKRAEAGQLSALASDPSVGRGDGRVGSCHVPEPVGSLPREWEDGGPLEAGLPIPVQGPGTHPHLRFPKGTWGHMSVGMCAGGSGHADPGGLFEAAGSGC